MSPFKRVCLFLRWLFFGYLIIKLLSNQQTSRQKRELLSIVVTDGQSGAINPVTNLKGTVEFLVNLGKLHRAFSVHHKNQPYENCTLREAYWMVKAVSSNCNGTI